MKRLCCAVRRQPSVRVTVATLCLAASSAWPGESSSRGDAPETLENGRVRVTLSVLPSHRQWRLRIDARKDERWLESAVLSIHGQFRPDALQREYVKRSGRAYPLQGAMPCAVQRTRTDQGQELTFRLTQDEVWMDVRIGLPEGHALVTAQRLAASHPSLSPQSSVRFTEPVFFLAADADDAPLFRREWSARDSRDRSVQVRCAQYMAAWGPSTTIVPMVLWWPAGKGPRRAHWVRGGLNTVHLDLPYVLAFDAASYERTAHAVQHRAIGFVSLAAKWKPAGGGTVGN